MSLSELLAALDEEDDAILVRVYVQPNASRPGFAGVHGDAIKVRVTAPPEHGRANDAVVALLADTLGVPARDVTLVRGARSRRKVLRVARLGAAEVLGRLAAAP